MHTYQMLDDPADLEKVLVPVLEREGIEVPPIGCYAAAVEFDEAGKVYAFQILQNALFAEGLWSRDKGSNLLRLHRMVTTYAKEKLGASRMLSMAKTDERGEKIGSALMRIGYELMPWKVYRRKV